MLETDVKLDNTLSFMLRQLKHLVRHIMICIAKMICYATTKTAVTVINVSTSSIMS